MVWIMTDQDMVNRNSNEMLLTDARITWGWKIEYGLLFFPWILGKESLS